ncbi:uncharacterized protein METZ01_LOCUS443724 [marine metagenome]|uniref:Uncharacterized protein n=1 Tax=marine metagenome TaxID=408172 RepID=A0A382Z6F8_9ZZZZ
MKNIILILLLYLPLVLGAQNLLEKSRVEDRAIWVGFQERIEGAVERGEITREQAGERYAEFRRRMAMRDTDIVGHYEKLGIKDLNRIKNALMKNGIFNSQLDAVLGGMLRVIHAAKAEGDNFEMNPRVQAYFQDRIGLTQDQTQYVKDISIRIANRLR